MSYSGDNRPLNIPTPAAIPSSGEPVTSRATRAWAQSARREIEARLEDIERAAAAAAGAGERQRAGVSAIQQATQSARDTLAALEALLALDDEPLRMAPLEVSDLLMAALARWKPRAPRHTFELALAGHEPTLVGDAERIGRALDAMLAWLVASSAGGDVRVALRYAPPTDSSAAAAGDEALITLRARLKSDSQPAADPQAPEGLALALELARAVARTHGGRIWTRPVPEDGAYTLGMALPPAPPSLPTGSDDAESEAEAGAPEGETRAAASPSLPLARQRQVALVAHADSRMARYLRVNLERAGYRALTALDGAAALRLIDAEEPDLILLDAALDGDGPAVSLQRALARTSAPIIVLTGASRPAQAAAALDAGAADVIAMPLSIEETLARVRRLLRAAPHTARGATGGVTICGDLLIDEAARRVTLAGAPVALSKTEFRLLRTLARNAGKTVTHETLLEQVWGPAYSQEVEFIWVYIRRLRRKIEPDPARPRYIQTAPGVGYQLSAPVSERAGV